MSLFDPHGYFKHRQKSTKKGQVLQKKPIKNIGAIGYDEIPRSLKVLQTFRYTVIPPGGNPPSSLFSFAQYSNTYFNGVESDVHIHKLMLSEVLGDFQSNVENVFNINPEDVLNFELRISLQTARIETSISTASNIFVRVPNRINDQGGYSAGIHNLDLLAYNVDKFLFNNNVYTYMTPDNSFGLITGVFDTVEDYAAIYNSTYEDIELAVIQVPYSTYINTWFTYTVTYNVQYRS